MGTGYLNILNVGTALPIVFKGNTELYKYIYQDSFIHICGHTFYQYSINDDCLYTPQYKYISRGYKVMDIIHILATFDAEREYNKLFNEHDLKTHYQRFLDDYNFIFKKYVRWSIEKFCDEICKYFNGEGNYLKFYVYGEKSKELFLKLIKTIYFYNDAMQKLSKYRYGVFKVRKLSICEAQDKLKSCILVAGGDCNKALFENIERIFCN